MSNDREMATLLLEGGSFQVGHYTIVVYDPKQNTLLHQYHFSAW